MFADPAARIALESITHPLVRTGFVEPCSRQPRSDAVVVNDIPLLTTLAAAAAFHLVVGVRADAERRVRPADRPWTGRGRRPGANGRPADRRPNAHRCATSLLDNDGGRADVVAAVDALWHDRLLPFEENTRLGRRAPRPAVPQLVDPQPRWATDAVRLAARASLAAGGARVDHIGSTAIPAMPAKDVIDLQLTVPDLATADELAEALVRGGFSAGDRDSTRTPRIPLDDDPDRWRKRLHGNADPGQSLNLHVRVKDSPAGAGHCCSATGCRAEPAVAAEYLAVKRRCRGRACAATRAPTGTRSGQGTVDR